VEATVVSLHLGGSSLSPRSAAIVKEARMVNVRFGRKIRPSTTRQPDSHFPGRDTYSRVGERHTSTHKLLVAGLIAVLLLFGVVYFFGNTQNPNNPNPPPSTSTVPQ
jgi:hypothetical protein